MIKSNDFYWPTIDQFCWDPLLFFIVEQTKPDAWTIQPGAEWTEDKIKILKREQQRLAGYRAIVLHTWPYIPKKVRRPLSSCSYMLVRATYPPTDDEEQFAEHEFSVFRIAPEAHAED